MSGSSNVVVVTAADAPSFSAFLQRNQIVAHMLPQPGGDKIQFKSAQPLRYLLKSFLHAQARNKPVQGNGRPIPGVGRVIVRK